MTVYLTADDLVAINAEHGGPMAGVRDMNGVRGAADRPSAGFGGYEEYPTIWEKAGVLLHGIASTQHFHDGNKRTAWIAARLFLGLNGQQLRETPTVTKQTFVVAMASERLLLTPEHASEWLKENAATAADRVEFAALVHRVWNLGDGVFNLGGWPVQAMTVPHVPFDEVLNIVARLYWLDIDQMMTREVTAVVESPDGSCAQLPGTSRVVADVLPRITDSAFPDGIQGWNDAFAVPVSMLSPGLSYFHLLIDGEIAWTERFTVAVKSKVPDFPF